MEHLDIDKDFVFQAALTPHLYDECDYELYWYVALGHLFGALAVLVLVRDIPDVLFAELPLVGTFLGARYYLRLLARADPLHRHVARRQKYYKTSYAPASKVLTGRIPHTIPPVSRVLNA